MLGLPMHPHGSAFPAKPNNSTNAAISSLSVKTQHTSFPFEAPSNNRRLISWTSTRSASLTSSLNLAFCRHPAIGVPIDTQPKNNTSCNTANGDISSVTILCHRTTAENERPERTIPATTAAKVDINIPSSATSRFLAHTAAKHATTVARKASSRHCKTSNTRVFISPIPNQQGRT